MFGLSWLYIMMWENVSVFHCLFHFAGCESTFRIREYGRADTCALSRTSWRCTYDSAKSICDRALSGSALRWDRTKRRLHNKWTWVIVLTVFRGIASVCTSHGDSERFCRADCAQQWHTKEKECILIIKHNLYRSSYALKIRVPQMNGIRRQMLSGLGDLLKQGERESELTLMQTHTM